MRKSYRDMEKFRETKRAQKKRYYAKTQNAKTNTNVGNQVNYSL